MKARSIRKTLLTRCGIGVGLLLLLLSTGVYLTARRSLYREIDDGIRGTAALLSNQVELEGGEVLYEWGEGLGANNVVSSDDLFQFWDETSDKISRSPALGQRNLPRFAGPGGEPEYRDIILPGGSHGRALGMRILPFVLPDEIVAMRQRGRIIDVRSLPQILVVAEDSGPILATLRLLRVLLGAGSLLTLGLALGVIDRVIRQSLRPIDELAEQVESRSGRQLDAALDLPASLPTELVGLARNFDLLLGRVATIRERETDFIRHAAHELRTPIAGLRATTDLALSQPRSAAEYQAHLATCQRAAIDLGELVKRLSALARIGRETSPPSIGSTDLAALVRDCIETHAPRFDARGMRLVVQLPDEPLVVATDAAMARIIVNNLLDNAASHADDGSEIQISANSAADHAQLRIANRADDLPHPLERLFEPLFRKEYSRHDSASHLGIGLTLSLEAATAIGATLEAGDARPGWIEFTLTLPRRTEAAGKDRG